MAQVFVETRKTMVQPPTACTTEILLVEDIYRYDWTSGRRRSIKRSVVRKTQISSKPENYRLHYITPLAVKADIIVN